MVSLEKEQRTPREGHVKRLECGNLSLCMEAQPPTTRSLERGMGADPSLPKEPTLPHLAFGFLVSHAMAE